VIVIVTTSIIIFNFTSRLSGHSDRLWLCAADARGPERAAEGLRAHTRAAGRDSPDGRGIVIIEVEIRKWRWGVENAKLKQKQQLHCNR
jgi:hypothetical protein